MRPRATTGTGRLPSRSKQHFSDAGRPTDRTSWHAAVPIDAGIPKPQHATRQQCRRRGLKMKNYRAARMRKKISQPSIISSSAFVTQLDWTQQARYPLQ